MYHTRLSNNLECSMAILEIFQIGNLTLKMYSTPQKIIISMYGNQTCNLNFRQPSWNISELDICPRKWILHPIKTQISMYHTRLSDNLEFSVAVLEIFRIGNLTLHPQKKAMYHTRKSDNLEFSVAILEIF